MGALLISVVVLYYFTRYPNDPAYLKLLVAAVTTSDTIHQALITHSVYWYLVTEYGNPKALTMLVKTILVEVVVQGFTGFLVQGFFTMRVWKLSKGKLYLVIPVAVMVLTELGMTLAYGIISLSRLETFADLAQIKSVSACMNVFAAVPDVTIAAILCTILHRSRTRFSKSNTLINRLIAFSINTGLLTSVCACISLITFFALPNTFVYICFFFLIGRLYSNSLMATLNARKSLRDGSSNEASISLRDVHGTTGTNLAHYNVSRAEGIAIRIDTTKDMKRDPGSETDVIQDNESAQYDHQTKQVMAV
ncbi:hypothetical protein BD311DRAFT_817208 [Dichomitus squalens]|uniref:DUF6534 domain-containing protein n=1 Tax=Dichomitus squalens TaxID=114155 RepID=A0A4V2K1B7_9APHY|nr:hypothetical protein BD311DRAFT_817208 [Dichomitus squalens]